MENIKTSDSKISFVGKIMILIIVLYLGVITQKIGSKYIRQTFKSTNNQVDKLKTESKIAIKF